MALAPTVIVDRRRNVLIGEWRRDPLIVVQVESPDVLPVLTFLDDRGQGAGVGAIGRRSQTNTVIVSRAGDPDTNASVWVRASYTGYRSAYIGFLNYVYGTQATSIDLAGYDVDHLLNRARSPGGAGYIRIEAVNSAVNQAWGRLFERVASNPAFFANQNRMRRTLSWTICAKLGHQFPPNGPQDVAGIDRLALYLQTQGMNASEARDGLLSMLQFAYRVP
ncbi:MAG: hypothetical protein U1E60_12220 [Reyranellaceae bacterium]